MKEFILLSAATALVIMTSGCGVVGTSNNGSSGTAPAATEASTSAATEIPQETAESSSESVTTIQQETAASSETEATQAETAPAEQEVQVSASAPSHDSPDYAPAPYQYDNVEGLTYIGGMLIANKTYGLPSDFNPGLDSNCEIQFEKLTAAAALEGLNIYFASGFRSYDYQSEIYNGYVSDYGQASADTFSARPGYSEHQSGLAIDVNSIDDSFAGTPEAIWLAEHCYEYGFILRYPQGKQDITGYKYEPWHIRYVGTDLSYPIYESGLTVEEYFGITSEYAN